MPRLRRSNEANALNDLNISQAEFRDQLAALTDSVRALGGSGEVTPGAAKVNDPLSAPYVLYVNPYTGRDTFAAGDYATADDGSFEQKMKRISNQRLECGYSPAAPFRTINRAAIEAAIITSRDYFTIKPAPCGDLVSIMLAPGVHQILNGPGIATLPTEWADGHDPSDVELQNFNPAEGGVIIPRGASLCSLDLRKCIVRPTYVPPPSEELADYSNRSAIFRMTGGGYYFGLTFMDKDNAVSSHHLLDCFQFASKAQLDSFYSKVRAAVENPANLDPAYAVTRQSEYRIVGQFPGDGAQTRDTDTVQGASPYIYNCSARSVYGLCGVFVDGGEVEGLKSCVLAQFTGVSLQRDLGSWQKYNAGTWGNFADYDDYIGTDPDDVRMNPLRRSFHIRAVDNAVVQEVSVFAIGQGIHHWVKGGAQITITNSNSNFGGCAALADGYQPKPSQADADWAIGALRVASDLSDQRGNITKVYLGNIKAGQTNAAIQAAKEFELEEELEESPLTPGQPEVLDAQGYTLRNATYLWIDNPLGKDYRVLLPANAWDPANPAKIKVNGTIEDEEGHKPGDPIFVNGFDSGLTYSDLEERRVYIRRLKDTRRTEERRYSLILNNTTTFARLPLRDYVLQTTSTGASVNGPIPENMLLAVMQTGGEPARGAGVTKSANVSLRRINSPSPWRAGNFYRPGDNVTRDNKHWVCTKKTTSSTFDIEEWQEAYVHMEESYNNEDFFPNAQPSIIFDRDKDDKEDSRTLGYNLATVWSTDPLIVEQYRTATDYLSLHSLLMSFGFSANDAHTILLPKPVDKRDRNPGAALDGISDPGGAVNSWDNWPVEFRRPSNIRLFGHAYEWAGYLNYTKALPRYQKELGIVNKFTYYLTHKDGGRVYASGFNEEGFVVSNRGLEDLATGTTLSVDQLGSDEFTIDFPTFYENLAVNDLSINNSLSLQGKISGTPSWTDNPSYLDGVNKTVIGPFGEVLPALPNATTDQRGVIELATADEARAFIDAEKAITPATLIQALGDAVKSVVNARLSLSPSSSIPNGNQSGNTIYMHPWNGNELALFYPPAGRWRVRKFSGLQSFSLAGLSGDTNYDVYVYDNNANDPVTAQLRAEFAAWGGDTAPPARDERNGIEVKKGDASRRFVGVVRTTSAGQSIIDLGGVIPGSNSANYPRLYLANAYNLYDASARYFFGNSWSEETNWGATAGWAPVPASVYPTAPRVSFVQAGETLVTAFLDIYSNYSGETYPSAFSLCYVAPGIDSTWAPPTDAFYGETIGMNDTVGSQWSRALAPGKHDIYYLYKHAKIGAVSENVINEHPAHGAIVTVKV